MSKIMEPEMTPTRLLSLLSDLDRWRRDELKIDRDKDWNLDQHSPEIQRQMLVEARAKLNLLIHYGYENADSDVLEEILPYLSEAQLLERQVFTPARFMNAALTCKSGIVAEAFDDFAFAISVLRWNLLVKPAPHRRLEIRPEEYPEIRSRIRNCHSAIRTLFMSERKGVEGNIASYGAHLQLYVLSGEGPNLAETLAEAIAEILDLPHGDMTDRERGKLYSSLGFMTHSVLTAIRTASREADFARKSGFPSEQTNFRSVNQALAERLSPLLQRLSAFVRLQGIYRGDQFSKVILGLALLLRIPIDDRDKRRIGVLCMALVRRVDLSEIDPKDLGFVVNELMVLANSFDVPEHCRAIPVRILARILRVHFDPLKLQLNALIPGRRFVAIPHSAVAELLDAILYGIERAQTRFDSEKEALDNWPLLDTIVHMHGHGLCFGQVSAASNRTWLDILRQLGPGAVSWQIRAETLSTMFGSLSAEDLCAEAIRILGMDILESSNLAHSSRTDALVAVTRLAANLPGDGIERFIGALRLAKEKDMLRADAKALDQLIGRTRLHAIAADAEPDVDAAVQFKKTLLDLDLMDDISWASGQLQDLARVADALPDGDPHKQALIAKIPTKPGTAKVGVKRDHEAEARLTANELMNSFVTARFGDLRDKEREASQDIDDLEKLFSGDVRAGEKRNG